MDNVVRVYDRKMNLLATFDGNTEGLTVEEMRNLMVAPTVHRETNGSSTLSFQMVVNCEKWQQIKDPENIYELNDRYYTALADGAYEYAGEGAARIVNVTLYETWYLLDKKYVQAYNCGLYVYAKATFSGYVADGARFTISASGCSNPSNTISSQLAWNQVKLWSPEDEDGNSLTYGIIKTGDDKPTKWENAPAGVAFSSFSVSGNTATVTVRARAKTQATETFEYTGGNYSIGVRPYPVSIDSVYVNTTLKQVTETSTKYITSNKTTTYSYSSSSGSLSINYRASTDETINSVIVNYSYYDLGDIQTGATCTFAYGAEVVDEHTFVILPKANSKYKLTVNGVEYDDSQVKDARGVVMPRGSAGYAMWAALRDTGWRLGICDVIAKDFDASIDYGCFNLEADMRDVLYVIQYIQELYGGILDFDSKNKIVNYRGENTEDYEAYNDGFNEWTGYEFREGKNMTDQPKITVDNTIITRAYLLGYGNLNVKKVNDGKTYVENFSYTDELYEGYLDQPLIYDTRDDGGMKQLLYWGKKELKKKCKPRTKIEISATDIRTAEGYEHEIFDLNDVVHVLYRDSETGEEIYEEKRITTWEYNAFAMWDCTVELGDKTSNLTELFRLVYNKAIQQTPTTNASGQISSDEIVIEIPNWGDLEIDYDVSGGGYGYGGGYGGYGYGGLSSMSDYLELIVRKTTDNTDAIAGLILEANELYAYTEQFSSFQKVTEDMVSQTYAGLKTYADAELSRVELVAEGHYNHAIEEIGRVETYSRAGFEAQQEENEAFSRQFSQVNSTIRDLDGNITEVSRAQASFETYADRTYATAEALATLDSEVYDLSGNLKTVINAQASFEATVTKNYAKTEQLSSYTTKDYVTGQISTSESSIKTWAGKNFASISLEATVDSIGSCVQITNSYTYLCSTAGSSTARVSVTTQGYVSLLASSGITIGSASTPVSIRGINASWQSATISGTTIHYLGY